MDRPQLTDLGSSLRFGAAAGGRRSEDGPLLTGRGRFTDDLDAPGQAHGVFVRSQVAHAMIRRVDATAARALPGVLAILTGADARADGLGAIPPAASFPGRGGTPLASAPIPPLAVDRVRYVGEAVAIAVAETPAQAADAAAAVVVDLDPLPAASDVAGALAPGAPAIWPDAPGNVAFDWADGDAAAVDAAFASPA